MFDANGTEGLELFTWVVGGLIGLIAALTFTHFLSVQKEDTEIEDVEPVEATSHTEATSHPDKPTTA